MPGKSATKSLASPLRLRPVEGREVGSGRPLPFFRPRCLPLELISA